MRSSLKLVLPLLLITAALFTQSCRLKKYIPENRYLLGKVKIKGEPSAYSEDLYGLLREKPNKKVVGLRLNMWSYLILGQKEKFLRKKEEKLKNDVWEEPVLLDSNKLSASVVQMKAYLFNKGYFNVDADYTVGRLSFLKLVNRRKIIRTVTFHFRTGDRYQINKVDYKIADARISKIFFDHKDESLLAAGVPYDGDVLSEERERITQLLRNNGYYNFSREFIYFDVAVDSAAGHKNVNVGIAIANPANHDRHRVYKVNNIYVIPEYYLGDTSRKDTLHLRDLLFITKKPLVKPGVLADFIFYEKGEIFETRDYQSTISRLSQLGFYKFIDIQYKLDTLNQPDSGKLDVYIRLSPYPKMQIQYELELNTREESQLNLPTGSNRTLGFATAVTYLHKNVAHHAIQFELRPRLTFELPINVLQNSRVLDTPTVEYGIGASFSFPELLIPFIHGNVLRLPSQSIWNMNFYNESNKLFKRTTLNTNLTYQLKVNQYNFFATPIEFSLVNTDFSSQSLKDTIEKSNDPLLLNLFDQHIIGDIRGSVLINQQPFTLVDKYYSFVRFTAEEGGIILAGYDQLFDNAVGGVIQRGTGKIYGIRYYQYFRGELDGRIYLPVWHYSNLALRGLAGFGTPYMNSLILPYEKRFFAGGANDIRAWQLRELGPGRFTKPSYFDHSGDIKLELNAELRFPIYGIFKGALFTDMGNIWTYRYDSTRAGSQLSIHQFPKQIAIGSGIGLRFDFTYFVFRLDMAVPVQDPSKPDDQLIVIKNFGQKGWLRSNINFNIGVGYPF